MLVTTDLLPPRKITVPKNSLFILIEIDTTLAHEREKNTSDSKTPK